MVRKTHELIIEDKDVVCVLGNDNYFSWHLEYQFGEWELSTIYGGHQGTFKTIGQALRSIGYERS